MQQEKDEKTDAVVEISAPRATTSAIQVLGIGDLVVNMAQCCHPVPGDKIIGYITRSRGISVHRDDCPNIIHEDEKERLIPVEWGEGEEWYQVNIQSMPGTGSA